MYKIVIPEDIADSGKQYLTERGYQLQVGVPTDADSLKKALADADGVIVRNAKYPKEVFEQAAKLKVISRHGTGVDNIDVAAAERQGIWVTNGPTANINAVAEYTVALIAALSCQLPSLDRKTRMRDWSLRLAMQRYEMAGSVVGLVGFGRIGQLVADKVTKGLDMKVIAYDKRAVSHVPAGVTVTQSLDEVLGQADYLSLHIPSTEETRGMFCYEQFRKMKKGSYFINCARGDVYVEADLIRALKEGYLAGAALDVYAEEPLKESDLYQMDRVILTQHNAGISEESKESMSLYAAMGVDQVLRNQIPMWHVNDPRNANEEN